MKPYERIPMLTHASHGTAICCKIAKRPRPGKQKLFPRNPPLRKETLGKQLPPCHIYLNIFICLFIDSLIYYLFIYIYTCLSTLYNYPYYLFIYLPVIIWFLFISLYYENSCWSFNFFSLWIFFFQFYFYHYQPYLCSLYTTHPYGGPIPPSVRELKSSSSQS
jgi:hypothetical protein